MTTRVERNVSELGSLGLVRRHIDKPVRNKVVKVNTDEKHENQKVDPITERLDEAQMNSNALQEHVKNLERALNALREDFRISSKSTGGQLGERMEQVENSIRRLDAFMMSGGSSTAQRMEDMFDKKLDDLKNATVTETVDLKATLLEDSKLQDGTVVERARRRPATSSHHRRRRQYLYAYNQKF